MLAYVPTNHCLSYQCAAVCSLLWQHDGSLLKQIKSTISNLSLVARRYKSLHKYEYQYEAESLNAIKGASNLMNGPKCSCKVEIEVPQSCSYILRTTGCSLSEVVDMDAEGNPVFGPAPGSDAFTASMEKHPLKVVVEGVYDVKLYPEEDESMTILNIKRGIVSALAVPLLEEENNKKMPTIHGMCKTNYIVNAMEDIATDITLNRDLSKCDHFIPQRDHTSPLALISGMHYPLAQLIRSSQTCNYKFDNDKKHMISGACTENHILVPFSHKYVANLKGLPMEAAEDKSVVQDKDAPLAVLRELATLSNGEKRAHLFQQLVSMVRGMKAETLSPAIPEALKVSRPLTYQVLAQCGTPECSSAIMQILRTFDNSAFEVDAIVFAMGLVPNPSALLVNDMLAMARYKQSKPILYALSNVVKRFYKAEGKVTPEIGAVAEFAVAQLGGCTGDKEQNFLVLRVIGNMAAAMGAASPALKSAVIRCVNEPATSLEVQQAAIQAFRQTPVPEEGREVLMQVLLSGASPLQKRVAAYLVLMKDPQPAELAQLAAALPIDEDQQAKSFVISHLTNILESTAAETQELRQKILDALQGNEVGTVMDPTKFSRNYMIGSVQGNMLFEGTSYLPKEVMLEMTLKAFGYNVDMMEVGMEGKGLEPTVEALFGENGFFPDTVLKIVYFVSDKMPLQVNEASQNIVREIGRNLNRLVRDLKAQESPEAMIYLRLLGNELGYLKTNELEKMVYSLMKGLMTNADNEVFAHYIFMDNEFFLPTATGVPLKIALSGTFTPGIKGGLHITPDMSEVSFMPSAGIEFVARVGSHIPEYLLSGLEMHTSLYHKSGLSAKLVMADKQVKLTIPAPQGPAKLISITNKLFEVTSAGVKPIPSLVEDRIDVSECTPFLAGMKYCTTLQYSDASSHDTAPYFPFTGDSKLAVELHPTGDVTEYTATIGYELLREGEEGRQKVDTVKVVLKAEGADPTEATATVKYNRRKNVLTTDIQIPDFDLEAGIRLGVVDGNTKGKGIHSISIDLINKNIPQLSLVGLKIKKNPGMSRCVQTFDWYCILLQATNNYLEKYAADIPYMQNLRVPGMPEITLPEKLFLNAEATAAYHFNNERIFITIPLPLGGKSSEELNFPAALTTPHLALPLLGLDIASMEIPIPELFIPETLDVFVPLFGKAQLSTKVKSNFYNLEGSVSAGKDAAHVKTSVTPILAPTLKISGDSNLEGTVKAGPVYGTTITTQSFTIFPFRPEAKIDSSLKIDSTILMAQNTIAASFANGELSVVSNMNAFEDILTHAAELAFKDNQLSLKCDTNALALGMKIHNQAEGSVGSGAVTIKMETNADHSENRIYSLVTASLDVNGLAVNSDATVKLLENKAAHKATLTMNKDGLATSGTTTLQGPFAMENTFNGGIDASKATLSIETKSALNDMKVENANSLTITLSTLAFTSKAEAIVSESTSYAHDITIDLQDYTASVNVNNDLKLLGANLVNEAQLKAVVYKIDFTGSLKGAYGEEELKHTYEINYADLTANAKCSTTGKLLGAHMSHNTELEIVGLAARIQNDARFNSQPFRFDNTIRASIIPFDFNLDAIFNADGDLTLYGKQSAQLYGKFLLKAQPLAFASSHECRASVTHQLDNGFPLETTIDNKIDTLLTPQEQRAILRMKSKLNSHALNQEVSAYNNAERLGLELSATLLTGLLNTAASEDQEFTISGFLKYDKNTDSHLINLPFLKSLPAILENIKITIVNMAEAIQNYINSDEVKAKLEALPHHVSDFVAKLNLEGKAVQLKQNLIALTEGYPITLEYLEVFLLNLKTAVEKLLMGLASSIQGIVAATKEMIASGTLSETVIERLSQELNAINEEYKITTMIVAVIDAIEELIKQIDMQKLKDSSISLLYDIDAQFEIKAKIENTVSELKQFIETFDRTKTVEDLRNYISSINLEAHVEQLMEHLPTEVISKIIESVKAVIQELDIIGKLNVFHAKLRGLIVKYEVDKKVEAVLEKVAGLIKQFKIVETIQVLANNLKAIDIPGKVMQMLEETINYLKATEIKQVIEQLNEYLDSVVQQLRSFDYNAYVDETNQMIAEYTAHVNELIRALEIPQKLQVSREFVNFVVSSALNYIEHLRKIKVADMIKTVKDMVDHAILNDLKAISERLKQRITDMDLRNDIISYLQQVSEHYTKVITVINEVYGNVIEVIQKFAGEQQIVSEVKQIIEGVVTGLKTAELDFPSFTIPLTDLVIPSMKVNLEKLQEIEIPTQLDIPEFTILGFHTVPATTVSFDDIKEKVTELIDFIVNFEIQNLNLDVFFGDLTMSYLPTLPDITLPEITFPEFSFPVLPKVAAEKLLEIPTLQIPKIKLPAIPSEISVPCFGKLYGEIKVSTPIYSIRTSAELQNSTDSEETPQLTAFLTSQAISPIFEIFSYNLDSTARVAIPKFNRVIVAETLKFTHTALAVEHQASVTLYRLAAQASAKTTVKATTAHYMADMVNNAFFATLGGMSASVDTTYNHQINIPILGFTNGASVTQKAVARLEDTTITLTIGNDGAIKSNSHKGTHKCDLHFAISPSTTKLTISADTDTALLKMKQTMNADAVILSHITFEARSEAEGPAIKNSLLVASGNANLGDMKVELKANHDTELVGDLSGILSNSLTVKIHPIEVVFDFQNKGNTKLSINEALMAKIDLQNDYSATIKPEAQQINTVALARFNQYKSSYNFTIDNNKKEAGIFATMNGEANLEFLTNPISIPEIDLPFINLHIPAISDLNLYEHTGLKNILTTTEQSLDVDSKILYQKSHFHSLGNLITELSLKSPIFNLNANAGLYTEDDLVFRLRATTASVFEALKTKLDGTTSLTTKRGLKLATALSLENAHIEGNHDSTFSLSTDNLEAAVSVATIAKIALPIFNLEANQKLVADTKTKPNAASTLKLKGDFNLPLIKAIGKAEADHSLKLEGTLEYISVESSIKGNIDGTILEYNAVLGALHNEANIYLNADGLRSTSKIIANAKLSNGETTILEMDVDENLAVEASVSRVYAVLKFASNNEANVITFNTKGKHVAQATIDFAPLTSLTADVEIDMSQPSNMGDISLFEKTAVELTCTKQKISTTAKIATPVYTTNLAAELKGDAPVFKAELKSSATSVINFLDYDSAPEDDVDILVIRATAKDADKIKLQVAYNMKAPHDMLLGLKERLPAITSTLNSFSNKYEIFGHVEGLKSSIINLIEEAYTAANSHTAELSQLSILFRNTVFQFQKTIQVFLDAAIKFLRETEFKLPGSEEITTLPEVLKQLTTGIATMVEQAIQMLIDSAEASFNALVDMISDIQVTMPIGDVITGAQIIDNMKHALAQLVGLVKHLESLDMVLEKLGETLKVIVEKAQEFVDTLKSDYLDAVAIYINALYNNLVGVIKTVLDQVNTVLNMEQVNLAMEHIADMVLSVVNQQNLTMTGLLQQASEEAQAFIKVSGGRLEIELPFPFHQ
uniref:Vitellogenin domain-containing protein n=1 Tax=Oncorhynchus tshawytscha TaxID=74940 RepID=A0AAZ3PZI9_ONCTS